MRTVVTRWAVRLHKWLALVVALQVVFWVLGGFVMTLLPIERVRGEHYAPDAAPAAIDPSRVVPLASIAGRYDQAMLKSGPRGLLWVLSDGARRTAVDATTGRTLAPLTAAEASAAARVGYAGAERPTRAQWFAEAPTETGRTGPLWRVDFADEERTALYLDPLTGEVVSRRSDLWRFFDFWWRLHILDFEEGEDINNPLIVTLAGVTVAMTAAGLVLLWLRLVPAGRAPRRRATD